MKKLLTAIILLFAGLTADAQNFTYGAINYTDYNFDRKTIDQNANAVVLREFGTTSMQVDESLGRIVLHYQYHVKIKIYNKEGFKHADVVIPLYKDNDTREIISDIQASTFNNMNGTLVETQMDKKALFNENRDKYTVLTKFTLPNIMEGSVIEYRYTIQTPLLFNFRTWEFQSDIPKVHSEYIAYIPGNYNYNVALRGFQPLDESKADLSRECFRLNGVSIDCSKMTYIMKNIPAFIEEDYMTAASNFKSAIYFELSDVQSLTGSKQSYTKEWKDVDRELTSDNRFGSQMKRKDLFKDVMPAILQNQPDDLSKAKAVYNYIKKQIRWNNYLGKYSEENIKTVLDRRSGNVGDINLSLIAALSAANLDAEAVILSTRSNGNPNKLFPVISDFDYVVAKVNIGDKSYLLDATEPLLPFGLLPLRCINDQGRVINLKKPSYWYDLKAQDKSTTSYVLNGKLDASGKIKGTISATSSGYSAYNKRREMKRYTSLDEFVEKLDERLTKWNILKHEIRNVDSVENQLIEIYDVEFSAHDEKGKDQIFINPFYINPVSKNPFNLNERTYPVDLGAASDERIMINITLPEKFEVMEKPQDLSIALPNNGGRYLLQTTMENNALTVNQLMQFNKAIYDPNEYPYLKEFYSRIIQNQKTDVLLKKAK